MFDVIKLKFQYDTLDGKPNQIGIHFDSKP